MRLIVRGSLLALALIVASVPGFGTVVFTDNTFNLANYSLSPTFQFEGTITASQCASCGNPGSALQIVGSFGDTTVNQGTVDEGFANTSFTYNPSVQGPIASITAMVDKNLFIDQMADPSSPFGNTFRPLIPQGGVYYMAAIPGPSLITGSTGFVTLSQSGLQASDFTQFDFATDTFGSGHPNFSSGGPMLFGLGQISGILGFPNGTITATYDNLSITVLTTPEPSSWMLMAAILPFMAAIKFARRRRIVRP